MHPQIDQNVSKQLEENHLEDRNPIAKRVPNDKSIIEWTNDDSANSSAEPVLRVTNSKNVQFV